VVENLLSKVVENEANLLHSMMDVEAEKEQVDIEQPQEEKEIGNLLHHFMVETYSKNYCGPSCSSTTIFVSNSKAQF